MTGAPLPPGLRPGGAADIESGLEHPLVNPSRSKSQGWPELAARHLVRRYGLRPPIARLIAFEAGLGGGR
jgi:hypothetical protein